MPLFPIFAYGQAQAYRNYARPNNQANVRSQQAAPLMAKAKPASPAEKLQRLGVPKEHAEYILNNHMEGDQPYHAGKLLNGNVYLLTQNDKVFYGKPNDLQKLEDVLAHRTKCINQQVRNYHTPDGLSFTVSYQKGQPYSASVTTKFLCFTVPAPHRQQTHFPRHKG